MTRYRPRGVRKEDESWDEWHPDLGPSKALHAAAYGKEEPAISFDEYRQRYLREMQASRSAFLLQGLRERVASGEDVALLCSSACRDAARCHRTLLATLIAHTVI